MARLETIELSNVPTAALQNMLANYREFSNAYGVEIVTRELKRRNAPLEAPDAQDPDID